MEKLPGRVQGGACLQGALVPAGRGSEAGGGFQVMSRCWSWARTLRRGSQGGGGERTLGRQVCGREAQEPPRCTDRWRRTMTDARVDMQTVSPNAETLPRADLDSLTGRPSCKQHTDTCRPPASRTVCPADRPAERFP